MPTTYTVQPGDSLSAISKKVYGDFSMTDTLATLNKIANKNVITPGQKIILPDVEEAEVIEEEDETTGSSKKKKLLWILIAAAAIGGGYYAYKKYKKKKGTTLSGTRKKRKA
jgi:LysM repeat protein